MEWRDTLQNIVDVSISLVSRNTDRYYFFSFLRRENRMRGCYNSTIPLLSGATSKRITFVGEAKYLWVRTSNPFFVVFNLLQRVGGCIRAAAANNFSPFFIFIILLRIFDSAFGCLRFP